MSVKYIDYGDGQTEKQIKYRNNIIHKRIFYKNGNVEKVEWEYYNVDTKTLFTYILPLTQIVEKISEKQKRTSIYYYILDQPYKDSKYFAHNKIGKKLRIWKPCYIVRYDETVKKYYSTDGENKIDEESFSLLYINRLHMLWLLKQKIKTFEIADENVIKYIINSYIPPPTNKLMYRIIHKKSSKYDIRKKTPKKFNRYKTGIVIAGVIGIIMYILNHF